jgi:hypothetical protein
MDKSGQAITACSRELWGIDSKAARPTTLRLTASVVISSEVARAKLNRGKLVNCSELQSVTSSPFVHPLFAFYRCSPQLVLRLYYVFAFQDER